MSNDDSSIDAIYNGDIIKIINDINFNSLYYRALLEKHKNSSIINVLFIGELGFKINRSFPKDITIKEMFKAFFSEMNIIDKSLYEFQYNSITLDLEDNTLLKTKFISDVKIYILARKIPEYGKIFIISIENKERQIFELKAGTLEQIKNVYNKIRNHLDNLNKKYFGNPILYQ